MPENYAFARRWGILFGAGAVGVAAIVPMMASLLRDKLASVPGAPPVPALLLASTAQSLVLLALSVAVGVRLAPELGLRSHLAEWAATRAPLGAALRRDCGVSVAAGVAALVATLLLDLLFRAQMPPATWQALQQAAAHSKWSVVLAGLLYGGITEEILMRWALMSLLAWCAWRLARRRSAAMWVAIVLSALAFGAGHLGATALIVPLTPLLVARALALNFVAGLACGWLFWKRSLEAAMMAHMAWHLAATVATQFLALGR